MGERLRRLGGSLVEAEQDPDTAPPYKYAQLAIDHLTVIEEKIA